jgi:putative endonuclease
MKGHNFFVYITTNSTKSVLYVGVRNDLQRRLEEHFNNRGDSKTFAGRYFCYNLVYYERFPFINQAIEREKELKKWRREKKNRLIEALNPSWRLLNAEITE